MVGFCGILYATSCIFGDSPNKHGGSMVHTKHFLAMWILQYILFHSLINLIFIFSFIFRKQNHFDNLKHVFFLINKIDFFHFRGIKEQIENLLHTFRRLGVLGKDLNVTGVSKGSY